MESIWQELNEPLVEYKSQSNYPLQDETYKILGACFEVFNELGKGFLEILYKDALEHELTERGIFYEREKKFEVYYKDK
jgi:hypothetical protein